MAMAKSALLVQVDYDSSPRAVLDVLNEIVIKTAPKRIMMTFFFGLLDPRAQTLRFSSAGHLDPYVYRAATGKLEALSSWGFPLGVRRREPFREHTVEFDAGDRLILYSDGLIEAIDDDGEPFGFERFEKTILASGHQSADEIKKSLLNAVKKFTRNRPPEDDQTLVVVAFEDGPRMCSRTSRLSPSRERDRALTAERATLRPSEREGENTMSCTTYYALTVDGGRRREHGRLLLAQSHVEPQPSPREA